MSREMAGIFSTLEDQLPPAPTARTAMCEVCGHVGSAGMRVDGGEVAASIARYRDGRVVSVVRCNEPRQLCRERLAEAEGKDDWPFDDGTWPVDVSARNDEPSDEPAVEVAPDPPAIVPATPAPLYADLDSDWQGF